MHVYNIFFIPMYSIYKNLKEIMITFYGISSNRFGLPYPIMLQNYSTSHQMEPENVKVLRNSLKFHKNGFSKNSGDLIFVI